MILEGPILSLYEGNIVGQIVDMSHSGRESEAYRHRFARVCAVRCIMGRNGTGNEVRKRGIDRSNEWGIHLRRNGFTNRHTYMNGCLFIFMRLRMPVELLKIY